MSKSNASDEFERAETGEKPAGMDDVIGEEGPAEEVDNLLDEGSQMVEEEKRDVDAEINNKILTELQI